jgi:plasmid stabilization system protein ParE
VRIDWSETAFDDLSALRDYIARDAPHYAEQFIDRLLDAAGQLAEFIA